MLIASLVSRLISIRNAVCIIVATAILVAISLQTQSAAWEAIVEGTIQVAEDQGDTGRIITKFTNAFSFFGLAGLWGFGTGSANLGALALVKGTAPFCWLPKVIYFEEESGGLVLELGILGWCLDNLDNL